MKPLFFALSTTTILLADYSEEVLDRYKQEVPMEPRWCECACSLGGQGPYTGPYICGGCDYFITADFLLWTARLSNIPLAATNQEELDVSSICDVKHGKIYHPDWSLETGFRVGVGAYFGCDGWRLSAEYTLQRFHDEIEKPELKGDLEIISSQGSPLLKTETSSGKFRLGFNVVDLDLGRTFCIDSSLLIDAFFGFKIDWQDYYFRLKETGESRTTQNPATSCEKFSNDTWGIGIRAGLGPRWYWSSCFSLYSEFAATAQWQQFDAKGRVLSHDQITGLASSFLNIEDCFYLITPILEAELGLRWEEWYCCDRYHFVVKAGWEIQWWGRQNQFIAHYTETRDGDLGLQGLTLSFVFDF